MKKDKKVTQSQNGPNQRFLGKIVSFSTSDDTMALKDIIFQSIANYEFVVGTIPKGATKNGWADERAAGIAWHSVTDFIIFDSEEAYSEYLAMSEG